MDFTDKNILITGGSGFLARAMISRLRDMGVSPSRIYAFARDEEKLMLVQEDYGVQIITGDVTNESDVLKAMNDKHIVFHFAAFKHLPLAEKESSTCIRSNVIGSMNVLRASLFTFTRPDMVLGVSTDKAYNPVNCYGMTKRLMEYMFAEYQGFSTGMVQYRIVRYGNVLGSTGSVLEVWKRARERGDAIKLTDPDMTRFFFTVDEAINTIFACIEKSKDATPYIPIMPTVRMGDMAEVMANGEVPVQIIGKRPGEKSDESMSDTYCSGNVPPMGTDEIRLGLKKLGYL